MAATLPTFATAPHTAHSVYTAAGAAAAVSALALHRAAWGQRRWLLLCLLDPLLDPWDALRAGVATHRARLRAGRERWGGGGGGRGFALICNCLGGVHNMFTAAGARELLLSVAVYEVELDLHLPLPAPAPLSVLESSGDSSGTRKRRGNVAMGVLPALQTLLAAVSVFWHVLVHCASLALLKAAAAGGVDSSSCSGSGSSSRISSGGGIGGDCGTWLLCLARAQLSPAVAAAALGFSAFQLYYVLQTQAEAEAEAEAVVAMGAEAEGFSSTLRSLQQQLLLLRQGVKQKKQKKQKTQKKQKKSV